MSCTPLRAASPIRARSSGLTAGEGASSTIFWWLNQRQCLDQLEQQRRLHQLLHQLSARRRSQPGQLMASSRPQQRPAHGQRIRRDMPQCAPPIEPKCSNLPELARLQHVSFRPAQSEIRHPLLFSPGHRRQSHLPVQSGQQYRPPRLLSNQRKHKLVCAGRLWNGLGLLSRLQ